MCVGMLCAAHSCKKTNKQITKELSLRVKTLKVVDLAIALVYFFSHSIFPLDQMFHSPWQPHPLRATANGHLEISRSCVCFKHFVRFRMNFTRLGIEDRRNPPAETLQKLFNLVTCDFFFHQKEKQHI